MLSALPAVGVYDHPALGVCHYLVTEVSDDPDVQVEQVIGMMRRYAIEDSRSQLFQPDIFNAMRSDDPVTDAWEYLNRYAGARRMQFVNDEQTGAPWDESARWRPLVEALIRPVDQSFLSAPQGDCDDFAMYGAAHLLARGVPCSFATVAADPADPNMYSHVYLVAYPASGPYAGRRVPMDLSHGAMLGWETENRLGKFREWPVIDSCALSRLLMWTGVALIAFSMFNLGRLW